MPPRNHSMNSEQPLVHQGNDKSGAVLVKIASRIQDRNMAEQILHLFFSGQCKCAAENGGLPVDTPEDLMVSCAYLEGQRESLSSETARIALPILLFVVNSVRAIIMIMQITMVRIEIYGTESFPPKRERVPPITEV